MNKTLAGILILALISAPAAAHGGIYRGPGDAGGPWSGGGGNSGAPTSPGGGSGPGAGSNGGMTGGPVAVGSGVTRGPGKTGGRPASTGFDAGSLDTWEFWWEANKDQFLDLKSHLVRARNETGRPRPGDSKVASRRPSLETIHDTIIPTLLELLKSSDDPDIDDSCLLALGRVAREDSAEAVIGIATPLLAHKAQSVRTAAALTLGALGSPGSLPLLQDLMTNSAAGQKLVAGKSVEMIVRALAALSLGLINDPGSVQPLIELLRNTTDAEKDLRICAITALGLMRGNAREGDAYQCLLGALTDRKLDGMIRSYVPTALGKLGNPEAVPALLAVFRDRDTDNLVRQSAAIGLGLLASFEQEEVLAALQDCVAQGRDSQTRHFCLISLAQIGRRDRGHEQEHQDGHDRLAELFGREITRPSNAAHRSWAALAAAIYAREGGIESAQADFQKRIGDAWEKERDPSFKGAFALALGLLDVGALAPALYDDFLNARESDQRGYTALALGFLKYRETGDELRKLCLSKTITPTFRLQVATGLGLIGDLQAVTVLVDALTSAQTNSVSSAVAKALGLIGDQDAVAPLRAIAQDADRQPLTRAFACVALGIVGEKTDLPWNARLRGDNNYNAVAPAMAEVLDIL